MKTNQQYLSIFYVVLSGLLFGLLGYFGVSILQQNISVANMIFWRFLFSSLFMGFLLLPQISSQCFSKEAWIKIFFCGGIFYGASTMLYFLATSYIGSGLAMVLFFTYPAIVMIINYFLYNQPIGRIYYLAIVVIMIGIVFLTYNESFALNLIGVFLSVLSAVFYALYIVTSKKIAIPAISATFLVCLGTLCSSLIALSIDHSFMVPQEISIWLNLLGLSIVCTSLPILFLLKGLRHIGSIQASILTVLEPIFVVIFGVTLLGESIHLSQAIGVIILLAGALLALLN